MIQTLMPENGIPASPDDITPEWLTNVLTKNNIIANARVTSFELESFGLSGGFVGEVVRLHLLYEPTTFKGLPSLVAKFPSSDGSTRDNLNQSGAYEREIRFYQELSDCCSLTIPQLYYAATDKNENNHVLLLEDINYARRGDVLKGCSDEQARLAIKNIARFHSLWWDDPELENMAWMQDLSRQPYKEQESFDHLWKLCEKNLAGNIPESFINIVNQSKKHVAAIRLELGKAPKTLTHGDFRLDNMFFKDGTTKKGMEIIVIDWQFATIGRGVSDVAWFMMYCMNPAKRRMTEMELLKEYHETLLENGVKEYTFKKCVLDYRLSMLQLVQRIIPAGAHLDFTSERGSSVISLVFERTTAALMDLEVTNLLPLKI